MRSHCYHTAVASLSILILRPCVCRVVSLSGPGGAASATYIATKRNRTSNSQGFTVFGTTLGNKAVILTV